MCSFNTTGKRLEINKYKVFRKSPNVWILNNKLLKHPWVKEEIIGNFLKYVKMMIKI